MEKGEGDSWRGVCVRCVFSASVYVSGVRGVCSVKRCECSSRLWEGGGVCESERVVERREWSERPGVRIVSGVERECGVLV